MKWDTDPGQIGSGQEKATSGRCYAKLCGCPGTGPCFGFSNPAKLMSPYWRDGVATWGVAPSSMGYLLIYGVSITGGSCYPTRPYFSFKYNSLALALCSSHHSPLLGFQYFRFA